VGVSSCCEVVFVRLEARRRSIVAMCDARFGILLQNWWVATRTASNVGLGLSWTLTVTATLKHLAHTVSLSLFYIRHRQRRCSFSVLSQHHTLIPQFKLYKHRTNHCARSSFFCERTINVWNLLPSTVNSRSLSTFKQSIGTANFLRYFWSVLKLLVHFCLCSVLFRLTGGCQCCFNLVVPAHYLWPWKCHVLCLRTK